MLRRLRISVNTTACALGVSLWAEAALFLGEGHVGLAQTSSILQMEGEEK